MDDIKPGYTRVSEILSQWDRFSNINPQILRNKATIGTNVHEPIQADHEGIYVPLNSREEPYFDSYLKWKKIFQPKYIEMETRLYHNQWMITGQFDAIIEIDGLLTILDFKTSSQEDEKFWALQGGFYHILCAANNRTCQDKVCFLKLDKLGEMPRMYRYEVTNDVVITCHSAVNTYRYFNS